MKKTFISILCCMLMAGSVSIIWEFAASADVNADCQPVPGTIVPTNFTGTAPTSVTAGSSFTLKSITSSAANNLPVTITSSDLKLSATNASETTYLKPNSSSYADPKTGYKRAAFPDWQLNATGKAGDKIVIKLVEATAHVENVGAFVCPLSATLATIDIVAPTSNAATSTNSPAQTSNKSVVAGESPTTETTKPNEEKKEATTPAIAAAEVTQAKAATQTARIIIKDEKDNFVGGVVLGINGKEVVTSQVDGSAVIEGLQAGQHIVKVSYKNTDIYRSIYVTTNDESNINNIVMPTQSGIPFQVFFAVTSSIFALASMIVVARLV